MILCACVKEINAMHNIFTFNKNGTYEFVC